MNAFSNFAVTGETSCTQESAEDEMRKWILLDTGSSTDIFCDLALLNDVKKTKTTLNLHTNGGVLKARQKGVLPKYGKVWHSENAITNILSLCNAKKKFRVTYDRWDADALKVHVGDGRILDFAASDNGIYRYDNSKKDFCFVETVEENKKFYTDRQIERAKTARKLSQAIGNPSTKDFRALIQMNLIRNCPVTEEDIKIAEKVFGKDITTLKGKSVRTKPVPVVTDYVSVPKALMKKHRNVELCADIMFIQGLPFLTTISKKIKYRTIEWLKDRSKESLLAAFDTVFQIYNKAGFQIAKLFVNPEFRVLEDEMTDIDIEMSYCVAQEHVPEIERSIRVVKE